jgi:hypothetical protein
MHKPSPFDGNTCRALCASTSPLGCARMASGATETGTGAIAAEPSGCFIEASIGAYQGRFRFDCVKGLVCRESADGTETCQPAAGVGDQLIYTSPAESVLCAP